MYAMEIFALFAKIWHISLTNFATVAAVCQISYAMWLHGFEIAASLHPHSPHACMHMSCVSLCVCVYLLALRI